MAVRFRYVPFLLLVALPVVAQLVEKNPRRLVPINIAPHPGPVQPIPYSHKQHLAMGLECAMCHTGPEPGVKMSFPATATCMSCHSTVATDKASIVKLARFANADRPIPWIRVYKITEGVNWSHNAHLSVGVQCEVCHGDVSQLEVMAEVTAVRAMASCIGCHKAYGASVTCKTCHDWPDHDTTGIK